MSNIFVLFAILPVALIMIYISKLNHNNRENKNMKHLMKCFFLGILFYIPILAAEYIVQLAIMNIATTGTILYGILSGFLMAGLVEESFKYLVLKIQTKKSEWFMYSFDPIAYAIFGAMGFAVVENITYAISYGFIAVIVRTILTVPGHACTGAIMGRFYANAKKARLEGDMKAAKQNMIKSYLVPVLVHGIYDSPLLCDSAVIGLGLYITLELCAFAFVIYGIVYSIKLVRKESKNNGLLEVTVSEVDEMESFS